MRVSVWYRTEAKQPDKSGHYLSYRGFGMGGMGESDHEYGYLWYDKKKNEWRDYEYDNFGRDYAIVYYWTDATPDEWVNEDPPSIKIKPSNSHQHVALQDAWKDVQEALKKYETIKALLDEY